MKEKNLGISNPKKGMQRSLSSFLQDENTYSFMLNGQSVDQAGNRTVLSNEHSNIKAANFKEGFVVLGLKSNIILNKTFFILHNPEIGCSEIGYIENTTNIVELEDSLDLECKDCYKQKNNLSTPLELIDQQPHQLYTTLLEDSCNKCLALDINFPIKTIEIKVENVGTVMIFTDGKTFPKYIELDNTEQYKKIGSNNCNENNQEDTCLDCDKLRIFSLYENPKQVDYERVLGGNLQRGSYEILFSYSDLLGNSLTNYESLTAPIAIFDESDLIHEQEENNNVTNFGIKLELKDLDMRFRFFRIVVVYINDAGARVIYEEGVHSITESSIIISSNDGNPVTVNEVFIKKPLVETWSNITAANGYLFAYGLKTKSPINLQPVVNFMGLAVQWQSYRAKEDLYKNADSYQYLGYNRDEVIAPGISFGFEDGYETNVFTLIPDPATEEENTLVDQLNDKNVDSVLKTVGDCDGNIRDRRYEFYNTATREGFCSADTEEEFVNQQETIFVNTYVDIPSVPAGSIQINLDNEESFVSVRAYLEDNLSTCDAPNPDPSLVSVCSYFQLSNLESFNTVPETQEFCNPFLSRPDEEEVEILDITGETIVRTPRLIEDYASIRPSQYCNIYETEGERSKLDIDFSNSYDSRKFPTTPINDAFIYLRTRKRIDSSYNVRCQNALELLKVDPTNIQNSNFNSFYHTDLGSLVYEDLRENKTVIATEGNLQDGLFSDRLHKNALWFKTSIDNRKKFFINISQSTTCETETYSYGRIRVTLGKEKFRKVRFNVFSSCNSTTALYSEIIDLDDFYFYEVSETILNQLPANAENLYFAIDVPIVESLGFGEDWEDLGDLNSADQVDTFILKMPCGCFNIVDRDEEFSRLDVNFDSITLRKLQKYSTPCTFKIPVLKDCDPVEYEYGNMGHYESTDKYPDNKELFDSSELIITDADICESIRPNFIRSYTNGTVGDLNDETKFLCKNIRHFKIPDNEVSSYTNTTQVATNSDSIINPIGFRIDPNVVRKFLDVAVNNDLLTSEQRASIKYYRLHRADMTLDRSVVASGIMFQTKSYKDDIGEDVNYLNYPYNSLGGDKLNASPVETNTDEAYLYSFHSPETDYFKPSIPSEVKINGYLRGRSTGAFDEVDGHSKWVILGRKAETLATVLATAETLAEAAVNVAQSAEVYRFQVGFSNSANPVGIGLNIAAAVLQTIEALVSKVGRYRYEWLQTFKNLGSPKNFAYYYSSYGKYSSLNKESLPDSIFRGISAKSYINQGTLKLSDNITGQVINLNHIDRENTMLLSVGEDHKIENPPNYKNYDNNDSNSFLSSQPIGSEIGDFIGRSAETSRNISSPYASIKNYIPNQYGTIDSIRWVDTGACIDINETDICRSSALGGDTFITRHSFKRKATLFLSNLYGSADLTQFNYRFYSNYGLARFYIDYEVLSDKRVKSRIFPSIEYDLKTDSGSSRSNFYVEPPSKFYLFYYGFPSFLTETRINTNFRNARKEPENQFYPQNPDYLGITEEKTVPIRRQERFFYNKAYSTTNKFLSNNTSLPSYYSKEVFDKQANNPNSVMYSVQDVSENSIVDPWKVFRPNDTYTFEKRFGRLKRLKTIESGQVLGVFENGSTVFNPVDSFVEGVTQNNSELGTGGIFARRPKTFSNTDLGHIGSQSTDILSCEFGHFIVDSLRGQIFRVHPNGQGFDEISKYAGKESSGMDIWFKENLPFKILRSFPDIDIDNPINGVGITMGWDSKYKRVFITKKDYILQDQELSYDKDTGTFIKDAEEFTLQQLISNGSLKDVSWTVSYKADQGNWESYFSFKPNYYIAHSDYFQTGINQSTDVLERGLWSHLLTNKSKQVFYGKRYPFTIEYPIKNEYVSKKLEAIHFWTEAKRYHDNYDYAIDDRITFNKAIIYNDRESSGNMVLDINTGVLSLLSKYPITKGESQSVLITQNDKKWSLNSFYNRVKSNRNNRPLFLYDENQIDKNSNPGAVSFYGKRVLERMTGESFVVRLTQDKTSQYDLEFKWGVNKTEVE